MYLYIRSMYFQPAGQAGREGSGESVSEWGKCLSASVRVCVCVYVNVCVCGCVSVSVGQCVCVCAPLVQEIRSSQSIHLPCLPG